MGGLFSIDSQVSVLEKKNQADEKKQYPYAPKLQQHWRASLTVGSEVMILLQEDNRFYRAIVEKVGNDGVMLHLSLVQNRMKRYVVRRDSTQIIEYVEARKTVLPQKVAEMPKKEVFEAEEEEEEVAAWRLELCSGGMVDYFNEDMDEWELCRILERQDDDYIILYLGEEDGFLCVGIDDDSLCEAFSQTCLSGEESRCYGYFICDHCERAWTKQECFAHKPTKCKECLQDVLASCMIPFGWRFNLARDMRVGFIDDKGLLEVRVLERRNNEVLLFTGNSAPEWVSILSRCLYEIQDQPKVPSKTKASVLSGRCFAMYYCSNCRKCWASGNGYRDKWQECKSCEGRQYPCLTRPLHSSESSERDENLERKPHDQTRCQKCQELGRSCVSQFEECKDGRLITSFQCTKFDIPEGRKVSLQRVDGDPRHPYSIKWKIVNSRIWNWIPKSLAQEICSCEDRRKDKYVFVSGETREDNTIVLVYRVNRHLDS